MSDLRAIGHTTKDKRLLRKAAYWLRDYASAFRGADEPGARRFRDKLLKLAAECRKQGHAAPPAAHHETPDYRRFIDDDKAHQS